MAWDPAGNIRGPKGDKGDPGEAPIRTSPVNTNFLASDAGGTVVLNSASPRTVGLPRSNAGPTTPPAGSIIEVVRAGTGTVTFVEHAVGAGTTTIFTPAGFSTELRAQHSRATVRVIAPGVYVLAGDLAPLATYPRVYQEPISGGPTSGTTELVVATLVVPAQPIDTIQVPSATVSLSSTAAGEQFSVRVRQTNVSGTLLGQQRVGTTAVSGGGNVASATVNDGLAVSVPASTSTTFVVTVQRISGSGTASTLTSPNTVSVMVLPDRS